MILKINGFEEDYVFDDINCSLLSIEDERLYSHILWTLTQQYLGNNKENEIIIHDGKKFDYLKKSIVITDIMNLEISIN